MPGSHRSESNAEDSELKVSGADENSAEFILTRNNFLSYILPYLSKEDIYSLRQVSGSMRDAVTHFFFTQHASMQALPAAKFSRNQLLNFLNDTQKPLPYGIQPSNLISMLHLDDSITAHIALLMHLLRQYKLSAEMDVTMMSALEACVYRENADWSYKFELFASLLPALAENERNKYIVSLKGNDDVSSVKADLFLFSLLLEMPKESGFFSNYLTVMRGFMKHYGPDALPADCEAIIHQLLLDYQCEDELCAQLEEMASNPNLARNKKKMRTEFAAILMGHLSSQQFEKLDISQKIIDNLNALVYPTLFQKIKRLIYDDTLFILNEIEGQLSLLNKKNVALLTKEKQAVLMRTLFEALPVIKQYFNIAHLGHKSLFGDILWLLEKLLTREDNKKLLTFDMKDKLIQFLSLLSQFGDKWEFFFFRRRNAEPSFKITNLILAADLDLADDIKFLNYAVQRPRIDRKEMLYLKLKNVYTSHYLNEKKPFYYSEIMDFLKATTYFLRDLSNQEASLLVDRLYYITKTYDWFYHACITTLPYLYEKISGEQWSKIKSIILDGLENEMKLGFTYNVKALLKLMEFAKSKKTTEFGFSDDDMKQVLSCLCYAIINYKTPVNGNCRLILKYYVDFANDDQLKLFADQIKEILCESGKSENYLCILSMHVLSNELIKRELALDFVLFMQNRLKEKTNDVLQVFNINENPSTELFRKKKEAFSMVVKEKDLDPTLLVQAFLSYLPKAEKDLTSFGHFRFTKSYSTNLILRMNEKELVSCRQILINSLNSLIESKRNDWQTIGFCQHLFDFLEFIIPLLNDDFNYVNILLPLLIDWDFSAGDNHAIKKRILTIIVWQLVSKGHAVSDDCLVAKKDDAVYGIIKCIAEKAQVVHREINLSMKQEDKQENKLESTSEEYKLLTP